MKLLVILTAVIGLSGCAYYTKLDIGDNSYIYSTRISMNQKQNDAQ